MIQASGDTREPVAEIVERLISRFHPRRIYLFGSRARGNARPDSDYDFLVEIDEAPMGVTFTRQRMTWLEDLPDTEVQVHVRAPGELELRKDDPGTIDWDVIREGRLLFALDDLPAIRPGPSVVREQPGDPPDSLDGWIAVAERDMRLARHLTSDFAEWKEGISFHSQQASEKYLKALIISRRARPARTHKLARLVRHLRKLGIDLGDLDNDASFLSRFAVDVRYPDGDNPRSARDIIRVVEPLEVTEAQARQAFAIAERIEGAVRNHLP